MENSFLMDPSIKNSSASLAINALGDKIAPTSRAVKKRKTYGSGNKKQLQLYDSNDTNNPHRKFGKIYDRQPRMLPDIPGVHSLSKAEVKNDTKEIEASFFEVAGAKMKKKTKKNSVIASILNNGEPTLDQLDAISNQYPLYTNKNKLGSIDPIEHPEEILHNLPYYRNIIYLTKTELQLLKKKKKEYERTYINLRNQYIYYLTYLNNNNKNNKTKLSQLFQIIKHEKDNYHFGKESCNLIDLLIKEVQYRGCCNLELTNKIIHLDKTFRSNDQNESFLQIGVNVSTPFGKGVVIELPMDRPNFAVVRILTNNHENSDKQITFKTDKQFGQVAMTGYFLKQNVSIENNISSSFEHSIPEKRLKYFFSELEMKFKHLFSNEKINRRNYKFQSIEDLNNGSTDSADSISLKSMSDSDDDLLLIDIQNHFMNHHCDADSSDKNKQSYIDTILRNNKAMKSKVERLKFQLQNSENQRRDAQKQVSEQFESIAVLVNDLQRLREEKNKEDAGSFNSHPKSQNTNTSSHNSNSNRAKLRKKAKLNEENGNTKINSNDIEYLSPEELDKEKNNFDTKTAALNKLNVERSLRSHRVKSQASTPKQVGQKFNQDGDIFNYEDPIEEDNQMSNKRPNSRRAKGAKKTYYEKTK